MVARTLFLSFSRLVEMDIAGELDEATLLQGLHYFACSNTLLTSPLCVPLSARQNARTIVLARRSIQRLVPLLRTAQAEGRGIEWQHRIPFDPHQCYRDLNQLLEQNGCASFSIPTDRPYYEPLWAEEAIRRTNPSLRVELPSPSGYSTANGVRYELIGGVSRICA